MKTDQNEAITTIQRQPEVLRNGLPLQPGETMAARVVMSRTYAEYGLIRIECQTFLVGILTCRYSDNACNAHLGDFSQLGGMQQP